MSAARRSERRPRRTQLGQRHHYTKRAVGNTAADIDFGKKESPGATVHRVPVAVLGSLSLAVGSRVRVRFRLCFLLQLYPSARQRQLAPARRQFTRVRPAQSARTARSADGKTRGSPSTRSPFYRLPNQQRWRRPWRGITSMARPSVPSPPHARFPLAQRPQTTSPCCYYTPAAVTTVAYKF